jgi:hypothetical protein
MSIAMTEGKQTVGCMLVVVVCLGLLVWWTSSRPKKWEVQQAARRAEEAQLMAKILGMATEHGAATNLFDSSRWETNWLTIDVQRQLSRNDRVLVAGEVKDVVAEGTNLVCLLDAHEFQIRAILPERLLPVARGDSRNLRVAEVVKVERLQVKWMSNQVSARQVDSTDVEKFLESQWLRWVEGTVLDMMPY